MKKVFAVKMLGAAAGLLFAGAGSAAAYPGLVHAAGTVTAVSHAAVSGQAGLPGTGANAGASAQASANADLSSASSALAQAQALTRSKMATSASEALHLYSSAAGRLADAARQAETMARSGMDAGASTLKQVASTISDEVARLTVSTDTGLHAAISAVPDVTVALHTTAEAAQAQAGATRAQVLEVVGQASSNLKNLVKFTPAPPSGSSPAPAPAPSPAPSPAPPGSGSVSVSASGSGSGSLGAGSFSGAGSGSASASVLG